MDLADIFVKIIWPFIVSLIITVIIVVGYDYFVLSFTKKKRLDKAIRSGHVVQARLIKKKFIPARNSRTNCDSYDCWYEYTYNGKSYRKHMLYNYYNYPPEYQELYFAKFPKDAGDTESMGRLGVTKYIIFIVVFAVALLLSF